MAWNVSASGKTNAVASAVAKQLAAIQSADKAEVAHVNAAAALIAAVLADYKGGTGVAVVANGTTTSSTTPPRTCYGLNVSITPMSDWTE